MFALPLLVYLETGSALDLGIATAATFVPYLVFGLVLGLVAGYVCHAWFPGHSERFADIVSLLPTAFLRLIKMIIAPLVFATLVVGIAKIVAISPSSLTWAGATDVMPGVSATAST